MRLNPDLLPCPECGQQTDSLKGYRLPTFLLFILVAASFKHGLVVGCPACMRKKLLKLGLINLPVKEAPIVRANAGDGNRAPRPQGA